MLDAGEPLFDALQLPHRRCGRRGEHQALAATLEQLDAQASFKLLDAPGDGGGVYAEGPGGGANGAVAHHRRKELKIVPIHADHPPIAELSWPRQLGPCPRAPQALGKEMLPNNVAYKQQAVAKI